MEAINKLEMTVAAWYKGLPHLPLEFQKWLATNAWWLALIGVILGAMSIFTIISATLFVGVALTGVGGPVGAAVGSMAFVAVLIALLFSIADLVLLSMAISPLKARLKKGWTLLFATVLLNVVSIIVGLIGSVNILGAIWGLLMTAVGAYFLFEIRSHFGAPQTAKHTEVKKTA